MQTSPIHIGNANKILLDWPEGAVSVRVFRWPTAPEPETIGDGTLIYSGTGSYVVDNRVPVNDVTYHYGALFEDADGATVQWDYAEAVAAAAFEVVGDDVQELVRDRLFLGLQAAVAAGRLRAPAGRQTLSVLTAPPPFDAGNMPIVSVHLDALADGAGDRLLGEDLLGAHGLIESEGTIPRVSLTIVGWSLNMDERIALRKAIKKIMIGNLPIWADAGMLLPQIDQQDDEDFQSYAAPVYLTRGTFTCLQPYSLQAEVDAIDDVFVQADI